MQTKVLHSLALPVVVVVFLLAAPDECQTDDSPRVQALRHQNAGFELARQSHPTEAIAEYDAGLALDPTLGSLYYMRSLAYIDLQDYQAALQDLNWAIELEPDPPQYHYQRAVVFHKLGDGDRAMADLNRVFATTSDPDYIYPARALQARITGGD